MSAVKLNKIKSLNDEVKEFQPVLNKLFSRLPNIKNVECTHGPDETGADFILTRFDPTLNRSEYIGVIVKTGKIAQNHSDIDRQIEECELDRKIEGGKKSIYLTEIWVVTNNSISNNAQKKIYYKYKNKKLQFINGQDIVLLLDNNYPEYWTDISIEIGTFLREVTDKSKEMTTQIDLLDISTQIDCYISQEFINLNEKIYVDPGRKKPPKKYNIQSIIKSERYIFIEGSMGTGKTKLLTQLAKEYSTNESFNTTKIIPYILTFNDYLSLFNSDIKEVINYIDGFVKDENKKYIIMFDGLDELKIEEEKKIEMLQEMYSLTSERDDCTIIVTSRPLDIPEYDSQVDKYFMRYKIQPFTMKQIINLINTICNSSDIQKRLNNELEKSHLFKVLPKTPISAIIIAKLLNQNIQEIPSTMTELYSKYTELVLGRWKIDKGLQSQDDYEVLHNVTVNLAKYFLDNELPRISVDEVKDMFDDYVGSRKLTIDEASLFEKLIMNRELFKIHEGNKSLSFAHRTFSEYFYACHLSRDHAAVINETIYSLYWKNTFFFYFGIMKDSPHLIEAIDNINFTDEEARLAKMFNNGNLLLAAYLTPYDYIEKSIAKSYADAAEFLMEVIDNKVSSSLTLLPKMHVLSIFIHCMTSSYGYDFFLTALEKHAMEIATTTNPSDEQFAELFLVNSTLLSLKRSTAFDKMITNYGDKIPTTLQIALNYSIELSKNSSPIIQRHIKKYMKKARKNSCLQETITELFFKPIDESLLIESTK